MPNDENVAYVCIALYLVQVSLLLLVEYKINQEPDMADLLSLHVILSVLLLIIAYCVYMVFIYEHRVFVYLEIIQGPNNQVHG